MKLYSEEDLASLLPKEKMRSLPHFSVPMLSDLITKSSVLRQLKRENFKNSEDFELAKDAVSRAVGPLLWEGEEV